MRIRLEGGDQEFVLEDPPFARGGEAAVYAVPGEPALVAKVYHRPTPEHADKLAALIAAGPPGVGAGGDRPAVAWPTGRLLATDDGRVVGCIMPHVANARRVCELYNPRARSRICPLFHYGDLVRTARRRPGLARARLRRRRPERVKRIGHPAGCRHPG
jgi:DNA-binding helix-hairpin-helix protein with protein kinase domain